MLNFMYDWTEKGTKESLEEGIGNGFECRLGWTVTDTDTVLCVQHPDSIKTFQIYVWNSATIREQFANQLLNILLMPCYKK